MTCQAVPLQAQSMVSNHPDHDPPSRPDATPVLSHRPPPPTRTHHKPPPRSWSTARAQCQRDTGSATSTTISPESATMDPPPRPPVYDPQTAIHGAATEALDLRGKPSEQSHIPPLPTSPVLLFLTLSPSLKISAGLMPSKQRKSPFTVTGKDRIVLEAVSG
ncbi:unnamed protein product [Pleuronectes platessa]|uniref:Uncharacterized protein n=1 Tax=Pleuronectes platessa TaxID=8262 RepID=A0A9N7V108_PLEPL|nr:unnamed protein product [Pleuronectes platessa]